MGCQCDRTPKTDEVIVNEIFATFKIRHTPMKEILTAIIPSTETNNNFFMTETQFQSFFNSYLISTESMENGNAIFSYWFDFYRKKPYKMQFLHLKFCIALLSKQGNIKEDNAAIESIIQEFLHHSQKQDTQQLFTGKNLQHLDDANEVEISPEVLSRILSDYIYSISLLTVSHFKVFSQYPSEFALNLFMKWDMRVIDEFIDEMFLKQYVGIHYHIKLRAFIENQMDFLRNDSILRKELSEFSMKYRAAHREVFLYGDYRTTKTIEDLE